MFYRRVLLLAIGLCVLGVILLMCFNGGVRAEAPRPTATPRMRVSAKPQDSVYLPLVMKNYTYVAPLWRFGVGQVITRITAYDAYGVSTMRFGWYVDWTATLNASQPYGIEYVPIVRVKQWKLLDPGDPTSLTKSCVTCTYAVPYTFTVKPGWSQLQSIAAARPGMSWVIGNEIERIDWNGGYQDEILPELYAVAYHDIRNAIRSVDPTAQFVIGGVVEFTPLRQEYLQRAWDEYHRVYRHTPEPYLPVDVWNVHVFVLQEKSCDVYPGDCWGAGIPAGISAAIGMTYTILDNKNFALGAEQVVAMRQWLKDLGQQNKPLWITEYGVNMPDWVSPGDFTPEQVRDSFMYPSFNYFLNQSDVNLGYAPDGYRLVQRWNWYSLDHDTYQCVAWDEFGTCTMRGQEYNGNLFWSGSDSDNPNPQGIAPLGNYWKQYVQSLPPGAVKPYAP